MLARVRAGHLMLSTPRDCAFGCVPIIRCACSRTANTGRLANHRIRYPRETPRPPLSVRLRVLHARGKVAECWSDRHDRCCRSPADLVGVGRGGAFAHRLTIDSSARVQMCAPGPSTDVEVGR